MYSVHVGVQFRGWIEVDGKHFVQFFFFRFIEISVYWVSICTLLFFW